MDRRREREREKKNDAAVASVLDENSCARAAREWGVCVCFLLVDGIDVRFVACLFLFWETMRMPEVFLFRHDNAAYWLRPWIDPFRFSL